MGTRESEDPGDQRRCDIPSSPADAGLYRSRDEHDACGVGFVAHIKGQRSHRLVRDALDLLINLEHRGACGSDPNTGDGAGILVQMPDRFLRAAVSVPLPPADSYGAGLVFLPNEDAPRQMLRAFVERIAGDEGCPVLSWRPVPTNLSAIGVSAAAVAPVFEQIVVGRAGRDVAAALVAGVLRFACTHRALPWRHRRPQAGGG
jgi:glutamate synthase (NADPH/NADH) large chain